MSRAWTKRKAPSMPGGYLFTASTGDGGVLRACPAQEAGRWHMSVSVAGAIGGRRYPTWDEIADARYDLLPAKLDFVLPLPPRWDYVNVGDVFHIWESQDESLPLDRGFNMTRTNEKGLAL